MTPLVGVHPDLAGLILLAAAAGFFVLEAHVPGLGLPAVAGVACMVGGAMLIFGAAAPLQIPLYLVLLAALAKAGLLWAVGKSVLAARRMPPSIRASVVGAEGICTTDLDPVGSVRVRSEEWTAESADGPIPAGSRVFVVEHEGLRLRVARF